MGGLRAPQVVLTEPRGRKPSLEMATAMNAIEEEEVSISDSPDCSYLSRAGSTALDMKRHKSSLEPVSETNELLSRNATTAAVLEEKADGQGEGEHERCLPQQLATSFMPPPALLNRGSLDGVGQIARYLSSAEVQAAQRRISETEAEAKAREQREETEQEQEQEQEQEEEKEEDEDEDEEEEEKFGEEGGLELELELEGGQAGEEEEMEVGEAEFDEFD